MNQEKIGKLISTLRKQNGWTQEELGNKLCVSGKAVSKWERGINIPDVSILNDLSHILGITVDNLLKGTYSSKKNINCLIKKFFILFLLLFVIVLFMLIFIQKQYSKQIYKIYSDDNNVDFNGYVIFLKDKKLIMLDDFKLLNNTRNKLIKEYSVILKSKDKIIFNSNTVYEEKSKLLSTSLHELNIELIENKKMDDKVMDVKDIKYLELILEYLDEKHEYDNMVIDLKIRRYK